jgi:hypothetical protein
VVTLSLKYSAIIQYGNDRVLPNRDNQNLKIRWNFAFVAPNIDWIGAVGGFASGPAFGLLRWELWQILNFWFFWFKPKERRKETG